MSELTQTLFDCVAPDLDREVIGTLADGALRFQYATAVDGFDWIFRQLMLREGKALLMSHLAHYYHGDLVPLLRLKGLDGNYTFSTEAILDGVTELALDDHICGYPAAMWLIALMQRPEVEPRKIVNRLGKEVLEEMFQGVLEHEDEMMWPDVVGKRRECDTLTGCPVEKIVNNCIVGIFASSTESRVTGLYEYFEAETFGDLFDAYTKHASIKDAMNLFFGVSASQAGGCDNLPYVAQHWAQHMEEAFDHLSNRALKHFLLGQDNLSYVAQILTLMPAAIRETCLKFYSQVGQERIRELLS